MYKMSGYAINLYRMIPVGIKSVSDYRGLPDYPGVDPLYYV